MLVVTFGGGMESAAGRPFRGNPRPCPVVLQQLLLTRRGYRVVGQAAPGARPRASSSGEASLRSLAREVLRSPARKRLPSISVCRCLVQVAAVNAACSSPTPRRSIRAAAPFATTAATVLAHGVRQARRRQCPSSSRLSRRSGASRYHRAHHRRRAGACHAPGRTTA